MTVVFDRGGWSPNLFAEMVGEKIDFGTYVKELGLTSNARETSIGQPPLPLVPKETTPIGDSAGIYEDERGGAVFTSGARSSPRSRPRSEGGIRVAPSASGSLKTARKTMVRIVALRL